MKVTKWTMFFVVLVLFLINWTVEPFASSSTNALVSGLLLGVVAVFLIDQVHRLLIARRFRNLPVPGKEEARVIRSEKGVVHLALEGRQRGMLFLTKDALHFLHRPLHSDNSSLRLPLNKIKAIHPFNRYVIFPTGLRVVMQDNEVYQFFTDERTGWISDIEQQVQDQESVEV